jgi:hypothetical protein
MARASIWQQKFDRADNFIVSRPVTVRGVDLIPGDPFDKTTVTTRTLRQLFESRKLKIAITDVQSSSGKEVRHIGRGRFAVFQDGRRITDQPMTKDEAEAYAAG